MRFVIEATGVDAALALGVTALFNDGAIEQSRNGDVLTVTHPVLVRYVTPKNRVSWCPVRDANPFFHLLEAMWMLAGCNDLSFLLRYVSTFGQYSDDGVTLHGAYGFRWRHQFGLDQLVHIENELRADPNSRRCVLQMWDAVVDPDTASVGGKDVPCNTQAYFRVINGRLDMTVTNRSNDAVFGCFGANAVHFSFLLEYMANKLGLPVGCYYQVTNNLHAYLDKFPMESLRALRTAANVQADLRRDSSGRELDANDEFDADLRHLATIGRGYTPTHPYLRDVVMPAIQAWDQRKEGNDQFWDTLNNVRCPEWRGAMQAWCRRRAK